MAHMGWDSQNSMLNVVEIAWWSTIPKFTFEYIWTNYMSKSNKRCVLVGTKIANDNNTSNNITITISNVCILCSPTIIFV